MTIENEININSALIKNYDLITGSFEVKLNKTIFKDIELK